MSKINFEPSFRGELTLLVVEGEEGFETELNSGSDVEKVGGSASNRLVIHCAYLVRGPVGFDEIERDVQKEKLRIEIGFDFAKRPGSVDGGNAF